MELGQNLKFGRHSITGNTVSIMTIMTLDRVTRCKKVGLGLGTFGKEMICKGNLAQVTTMILQHFSLSQSASAALCLNATSGIRSGYK
jgi:hypothetical protein